MSNNTLAHCHPLCKRCIPCLLTVLVIIWHRMTTCFIVNILCPLLDCCTFLYFKQRRMPPHCGARISDSFWPRRQQKTACSLTNCTCCISKYWQLTIPINGNIRNNRYPVPVHCMIRLRYTAVISLLSDLFFICYVFNAYASIETDVV